MISEDFDLGDFGIVSQTTDSFKSQEVNGKDEKDAKQDQKQDEKEIPRPPNENHTSKSLKRKRTEEIESPVSSSSDSSSASPNSPPGSPLDPANDDIQKPRKKKARASEVVVSFNQLSAKEKLLFCELRKFYKGTNYIKECVVSLVDELDEDISIRLINGLCTTFTEEKGARFELGTSDNPIAFDLKSSYSRELKEWKKLLFDPFRRNHRILWPVDDEAAETGGGWFFKTTLCQLNFFRWLLQFRILDFSRKHKEEIEEVIQKAKPVPVAKKPTDLSNSQPKKSTRQRKRMALFLTYRACVLTVPKTITMRRRLS